MPFVVRAFPVVRPLEELHAWFKNEVFRLTGVDPSVTPLGPTTSEVYCRTPRKDRIATAESGRALQ